jgi:hypothetical protein
MTHRYLIAFCFLSGEIVTPTAEDYTEGYVIDGECFALGQNNVILLQDCGQFNCAKRRRS